MTTKLFKKYLWFNAWGKLHHFYVLHVFNLMAILGPKAKNGEFILCNPSNNPNGYWWVGLDKWDVTSIRRLIFQTHFLQGQCSPHLKLYLFFQIPNRLQWWLFSSNICYQFWGCDSCATLTCLQLIWELKKNSTVCNFYITGVFLLVHFNSIPSYFTFR